MTETTSILCGTSGWRYSHWRDLLYPPGLNSTRWLGRYAEEFNSVEVNSSLFGPLDSNDIDLWCDSTPAQFRFSLKAPRQLSYEKKLRNYEPDLTLFLRSCRRFAERLGPIVFELPPGWRANPRRLGLFLDNLSDEFQFVFEFRDTTWHCDEIFELLDKHGAAYCIYQQHGYSTPLEPIGFLAFVRLHGPDGGTVGSYQGATLRNWVSRCLGWNSQGKNVYVYFDNDAGGFAVKNVRRFNSFLGEGAI